MQKDDVVRLVTASNPQEAHLWQQALAEEGIRAEVVGEYLEAGLDGLVFNMIQAHEIEPVAVAGETLTKAFG